MSKLYDVVILFSGGADSTLLLKMAIAIGLRPLCIFINYGQTHISEMEAAKGIADKLKVSLIILDLSSFGKAVKSSLTSETIQYEGVNIYNVPCRNTFLLSIASAVAESEGIPCVWFGADFSDRINKFPDCYQEYVVKIKDLIESTTSTKVKIDAPLLGMTKEMVMGLLTNVFGVDANDVHSGY